MYKRQVYSRQLLGDYPYYWQFGFRPEAAVTDRILKNIDKMNSLPIDYEISPNETILEYLCNASEHDTVLCDIIRAEVQNYSKLVPFLRWFSLNYCCEYSTVYMSLFELFRLKDPYSRLAGEWKLLL